MSEPFSSSTIAGWWMVGGISMASALAGVDGNALIGAFAGAAVFVLRAQDMGLAKRFSYFATAIAAGYIASPELMRWLPIQERGVAALMASAAVVTFANRLLDMMATTTVGDFLSQVGNWLSRKGPSK